MDFFGAQDAARSGTVRLLLLFALAVVSLVVATNLLLMLFLGLVDPTRAAQPAWMLSHFDWPSFFGVGAGVALVIAAGSLYKTVALSRGGGAVAEALGGRLVAQDTVDPAHRRVLNVVEEMAIAAGTPVPPLYLLERETGVNAFAAGLTPANAVIGLTRGAVDGLSRDQLQGVIAHELSHVVNGDMRLNIRLAGLLHGILLLGLIGYHLLHAGGRRRGQRSRGSAGLLVLGLGLMAVGFGGTFFANLIKASVSRQREFLADASAVQFTRNAAGIAGALKRIGATAAGGLLAHPDAPEMSHAYFAQGVKARLWRLSATHPPLVERIRRIEPGWDGRFPDRAAPASRRADVADQPLREGAPSAALASPGPDVPMNHEEAVRAAEQAIAHVGRPDEAHLRYAESLIGTLPAALHWAAREPYGARALVYALLLDRDAAVRRRQLAYLGETAETGLREHTAYLLGSLEGTRREHHLPLVDLSMPALRQLSAEQYRAFRAKLEALIAMDSRFDLFEWCLSRILVFGLAPDFGEHQARTAVHDTCARLPAECALVFSLLSQGPVSGGHDAEASFAAARTAAGMADLEPVGRDAISHHALDLALRELARLKPPAKRSFLEACAAGILADERVTPAELEVLRAIGAVIDCPVPPLLAQRAGSG